MRTFNEVLKGIKQAEKDVDRVLKAAKLQRVPKNKEIDDFWYFLSMLIVAMAMFIPLLVR